MEDQLKIKLRLAELEKLNGDLEARVADLEEYNYSLQKILTDLQIKIDLLFQNNFELTED